MSSFTITPRVDEVQEFLEIANDFSNPLDLVREAISNAFDAGATQMEVRFEMANRIGEDVLQIRLVDNGSGMDREGLQSFFDLGNSLRRNDPAKIGEKGHGTKVYFNSSHIRVETTRNGRKLLAEMEEPFRKLYDRVIPEVQAAESEAEGTSGTIVTIMGYNNNRRSRFTHEILRDYVLWFTKFGSIERVFNPDAFKGVKLLLKGLNRSEPETIEFGHFFPEESSDLDALFKQHLVRAPDHYCKQIVLQGHLPNYPDKPYEAIFSIEGNRVKYDYNDMLRRQGFQAPAGAYTIQERYGLWLCKDYIPIQRRNEWISTKGSEFTKFHAFINCQALRLTANRGSVDNTPAEYLDALQVEIRRMYNTIIESDDWRNIEWLEQEVDAYNTAEKERRDFEWREKKARRANVAQFKDVNLVQPERESGVFALVVQLTLLDPDLFPFEMVDYDTHSGIDVVAMERGSVPIDSSKLYYVEFKYFLTRDFNHSFENLYSIVCWDTEIKDGDLVVDVGGSKRKMRIAPPEEEGQYTCYFLEHPRAAHRIEVFLLKDYLREKIGLEFRPRLAKEATKRID